MEEEVIYKHGSDATDEYKKGILANIQIQKKDSDEDMYSFSDWGSIMNRKFVLLAEKAFSHIPEDIVGEVSPISPTLFKVLR